MKTATQAVLRPLLLPPSSPKAPTSRCPPPLTLHAPLHFAGQPQPPPTRLNVFEVDKEYEGPLHTLRVTTNYNPTTDTGDERFIETVVGYAAPDTTDKTGNTPVDPYPGQGRNYQVGDQILNSSPSPGGYIGWVCIGASQDVLVGKWQKHGKIDS